MEAPTSEQIVTFIELTRICLIVWFLVFVFLYAFRK